MGNVIIIDGDGNPKKEEPKKEQNQGRPHHRRRRGSGKNKKQQEDDLKKKWKEDEEKKKFQNKKIKDVWHQLVLLSLPVCLGFWWLANISLHLVADVVQRWLDAMKSMIK
jgi:hypothetical protein